MNNHLGPIIPTMIRVGTTPNLTRPNIPSLPPLQGGTPSTGRVPVIPVTGSTTTGRVPATPITGTIPRIIPGTPSTGRVSVFPVVGTPKIPGTPSTGRVPVIPVVGTPKIQPNLVPPPALSPSLRMNTITLPNGQTITVPVVATTQQPVQIPTYQPPPVIPTYRPPPVIPTYRPQPVQIPTYQPVTPTYQPVTPTYQPVTPTYQPVTPTYQPVTPTYQPVIPTVTQTPASAVESKIQAKLPITYDTYDIDPNPFTRGINGKIVNIISNERMRNAKVWGDFIRNGNRAYRDLRADKDGSAKLIIEYLMGTTQPFRNEVLRELGFVDLAPDVGANLLWYLTMGLNAFATELTQEEIQYVSRLTDARLLQILTPNYRGPRDRASLLFAIVSGKSSYKPEIADLPRYPTVAQYTPVQAWAVATKLYNLIEYDRQGTPTYISLFPPYVHLAQQTTSSPIEPIIAALTRDNVGELMTRYQVVMSRTTNLSSYNYFIQEISKYEPVLSRDPKILPPPTLQNQTMNQVTEILNHYTLKELIDAYEPIRGWNTRETLTRAIYDESRGGSVWSWRHGHCNNDDTMNNAEFTRHGEMNKDDPTNPTLSYGVQRNYRCYQISELELSFHEDNDSFVFGNPDYDRLHPTTDPTTGNRLAQDFPTASIRQLQTLLGNAPWGYNLGQLPNKITQGLNMLSGTAVATRILRAQYAAFSEPEKDLIRLFLVWLFLFGLWMRFWKGPGEQWPIRRIQTNAEGYTKIRCIPGQRDENVTLYREVGAEIMDLMAPYPDLVDWINGLHEFKYNYQTGEGTQGKSTIMRHVELLGIGQACMGYGGDDITETAYFLLTQMLNLQTPSAVIDLVQEYLPRIYAMEDRLVSIKLPLAQAAVERALKPTEAQQNKLNILRARRQALDQPIPKLPPFDPAVMEKNIHTLY